MQFWGGLLLGLVVGATGMWAGMTKPWRSGDVVAEAPADAGPSAEDDDQGKKRKRRRGRKGRTGGGASDEAPPPTLTAADRQIVWRGPKITVPDKSVDFGAGGEARRLSASEIDSVLQRKSGPILACIEKSRAGAMLTTTVKLQLLVSGQGQVQKVRIGAPRWLMGHGFFECAGAAARGLSFPATGAATLVDAPYDLY